MPIVLLLCYTSLEVIGVNLLPCLINKLKFIITTYRKKHSIYRVRSYSKIQGKGQRDDSAVKSMNFSHRDLSSAPSNYTR